MVSSVTFSSNPGGQPHVIDGDSHPLRHQGRRCCCWSPENQHGVRALGEKHRLRLDECVAKHFDPTRTVNAQDVIGVRSEGQREDLVEAVVP